MIDCAYQGYLAAANLSLFVPNSIQSGNYILALQLYCAQAPAEMMAADLGLDETVEVAA